MFTVSELRQIKVCQEALNEVLEKARELGLEKTRELGREQGLKQALEHLRSLIIRQLTRKIGPLSQDLIAAVQTLSFEQLDRLGEASFDFERLEDLNVWLEIRCDRTLPR